MLELNKERLEKAAEEFRYLLDRGYNREGALNFVASHHRLDKTHKLILLRSVFSNKEVKERRRKTASFEELRGKNISVDGYNVLIVLETMLKNELLVEGDDGYIRDISGVHGKYKVTGLTTKALNVLLEELKEARPRVVLIFFDRPVSKSGELAGVTRQLMEKYGVEGDSLTASQTDNAVISAGEIALTSDSVILQKARKCFDIAGHIVKKEGYEKILKL
ncbi:MAG: DUF434 domain-containing protein [Candidatus Freyarchaeota archaeon]|nr:DUF434 domain-containing protein [Candidatus Jordarchaeia archaeon]